MSVSLSGAPKLRLALKKLPTQFDKETQKNIKRVLTSVTGKAKGYLPANDLMLSGWASAASSQDTAKYRAFPNYDQVKAIRGIKAITKPSKPNRNGWSSLVRIENQSAAGAIYETSGRLSSPSKPSKSLNPNAREQFLSRLNRVGDLVAARDLKETGQPNRKMTGRVIFRAWAEDGGKATAAVVKAVESVSSKFNKGGLNG